MDKKTSDLIRGIAILCAVQLSATMLLGGYVVLHVERWKSVGRKAGEELKKVGDEMRQRIEKAKATR